MEYVILRAARPTYLNTQLPTEAAELIQFDPPDARGKRDLHRGIVFFARGPGIARVVSAVQAQDVMSIEMVQTRYLDVARVSERLLFSIPVKVQEHLGLRSEAREPGGPRFTDDSLIWFLPAPEYYEYRALQRRERPWSGPTGGGGVHIYVAKSILPLDRQLGPLTELETRIEWDEWRPRIDALHRFGSRRRGAG
ncbi:MAG TPA: hypothetical protein VEY07_05330 [Thermoplasmata archaeon]|nr:hypothetical protein [Thermoplasmata archaeon]